MKFKTLLNNIYIPQSIVDYFSVFDKLNVKIITDYHRSGDLVINIDNKYILKITTNIEALKREKRANDFLYGKINVSKTIIFIEENNRGYYLKSCVNGKPLCVPELLCNPNLVVDLLVKAINEFHSIDISKCSFYSHEYNDMNNEKLVFVHGDCCLPNILVHRNKVAGYIDLEAAGIGDPWIDYAWALWSLEYNLKTDAYNQMFLDKLGVQFDEIKYKKYVIY